MRCRASRHGGEPGRRDMILDHMPGQEGRVAIGPSASSPWFREAHSSPFCICREASPLLFWTALGGCPPLVEGECGKQTKPSRCRVISWTQETIVTSVACTKEQGRRNKSAGKRVSLRVAWPGRLALTLNGPLTKESSRLDAKVEPRHGVTAQRIHDGSSGHGGGAY